MQFINFAAIYFSFLAVLILFFYLLKGRKKYSILPTVFLWDEINTEKYDTRPRWRIRLEPLLFIHLLILLLFVMALMQPYLQTEGIYEDRIVLIIDKSASMQAEDVSPDRFNISREKAVDFLDQLARGVEVAIIAASNDPYIVSNYTTEHEDLIKQIKALKVTDTKLNINQTLKLSNSLKSERMLFFTDGNFTVPDRELLTGLEIIKTGSPVGNIAIIDLGVRKKSPFKDEYHLYIKISNYHDQEREVPLIIKDEESIYISDNLFLKSGETKEKIYELSISERTQLKVELDVEEYLRFDNTAYTVVGRNEELIMLIVGENNYFLSRGMVILPGVRVFVSEEINPDDLNRFDIVVFNQIEPPDDFEGKAVFINTTPPGFDNYIQKIETERAVITGWKKNHNLFRHIDFRGLIVDNFTVITPPSGVEVLLNSLRGPLIMKSDNWIMLTFNLERSNFPLQASFPLFLYNTVKWFYPENYVTGYSQIEIGDVYEISSNIRNDNLQLIKPDQSTKRLESNVITGFKNQGIYTIVKEDNIYDYLAVNLFSEEESNLTITGFEMEKETIDETKGERIIPLWYYIILIILFLLLIEWYIYSRTGWRVKNGF